MALMSNCLRCFAFAVPLALATIAAAPVADAFCGFYVAGADKRLSDKPRF